MKSDRPEFVRAAAAKLRAARATGAPCPPLRHEAETTSEDIAYGIQQENVDVWIAAGGRRVGYKIGLTSEPVQRQLGVDRPDFGVLMADMALGDEETFAATALLQPRYEAEVAFVLGRDLDIDTPTAVDLLRAIEYALPAIEIVDSRIADWNIGFFDTVADNASSGLFVLGGPARRIVGLDLHDCAMQMIVSGQTVSTGSGAACLGSPLNAAVWLARKQKAMGAHLKAGDVLLTGALGPMVKLAPGQRVEARIEGLGSVRVTAPAAQIEGG